MKPYTCVTMAPLRFLNKSTQRLFHNYGSYLYFLVSFMSSTLWISGIVMIQYLFLLKKEIQQQKGEITLKSIFSLSIYFGWSEFDSSRLRYPPQLFLKSRYEFFLELHCVPNERGKLNFQNCHVKCHVG